MIRSILNKTTILLLPGLEVSEAALVRLGLIGCFIGDEDYDGDCARCLFLVFVGADQILLSRLISTVVAKDEYDVGEFTILVMDWPKKWNNEWDLFMESKYSKFRDVYKQKFSQELPPLSKKVTKKEGVSNGWLIVHKHEAMRKWQEERIGVILEDWQEVSSVIDVEEEVFNYERFKEQYDAYIGCPENQK